jgi:hypothetical protein
LNQLKMVRPQKLPKGFDAEGNATGYDYRYQPVFKPDASGSASTTNAWVFKPGGPFSGNTPIPLPMSRSEITTTNDPLLAILAHKLGYTTGQPYSDLFRSVGSRYPTASYPLEALGGGAGGRPVPGAPHIANSPEVNQALLEVLLGKIGHEPTQGHFPGGN